MRPDQDTISLISSLSWYHTIDLGNNVVTAGAYDHRPYLHYYGFPDNLTGKHVIDIGAASGFFSFEFERRGADVTADYPDLSLAIMTGHTRGDAWWIPTRACLELLAICAGFVGIEWISEFQLNYRDGSPGPYHGVLHAYKTTEHWGPRTVHRDTIIAQQQQAVEKHRRLMDELTVREKEIEQLRAVIKGYESGRFIRFMRWLHTYRG